MSHITSAATNTVFGRGAIFFDRFDANGVQLNQWMHFGDCDSLATSISEDTVDLIDYTQNTGTPYNSATKSTTVALKISGFEFTPRMLAVVFKGDGSTFTQSATTVTGETLAPSTLTGLLGSYFRTANRNISAITVKQGTTTLVSATDWSLHDSLSGMVRILPSGSTVVDGTALTINYTAAALTAGSNALETVRPFNTSTVQGSLLFVPKNSSGPLVEARYWSVKLSPDGDVSLISDDWLKWNLTGTVLSDSTAAYGGSTNEPYGRILWQS